MGFLEDRALGAEAFIGEFEACDFAVEVVFGVFDVLGFEDLGEVFEEIEFFDVGWREEVFELGVFWAFEFFVCSVCDVSESAVKMTLGFNF